MLFKRKKKQKVAPVAETEAGFTEAKGMHYFKLLAALHRQINPDWYLEIGTQKGKSLTLANCQCIAIDPDFILEVDVIGKKPTLHMLQHTSDEAFEMDILAPGKIKLDFAFLDGMHLFEYLLRDFINTERLSSADGTVAIHDCVPRTQLMAEREWDKATSREWTGDVWKILPILKRFRPDLKLRMMDAAPTGLLIVSGLDPASTVLSENYDQIVAEYTPMRLKEFGIDRFFSELSFVSTTEFIAQVDRGGAA